MKTWTSRAVTGLLCLFSAAASAAPADQPGVTNARLQVRPVTGGLEREIEAMRSQQTLPAWAGYSVAAVARQDWDCCGEGAGPASPASNACGTCRLEGGSTHSRLTSGGDQPVALEGPGEILVLFRVENRAVGRIRVLSGGCRLDGGGLPLSWLTGVSPTESVAVLTSFVPADGGSGDTAREVAQGALAAIALHADPSATRALERLVTASHPLAIRKTAAFWLGQARGAEGLDVLTRVLHADSDPAFRKELVFPVSVSSAPGATRALIDLAHEDRNAEVRGQAIFWLGQKAGAKAVGAIKDAIANDPDTEVKKRAVFAVSQLPKNEGVPLLIDLAKTNRDPAVRKQAIFWLGQSRDPRALDFFEEILTR